MHEDRTFIADAVDVGRFTDREAAVIDARLHPADVVAHDEENVWLLILGERRRNSPERRQADDETRDESGKCVRPIGSTGLMIFGGINRHRTHWCLLVRIGAPH
jgi:hypothetical protein